MLHTGMPHSRSTPLGSDTRSYTKPTIKRHIISPEALTNAALSSKLQHLTADSAGQEKRNMYVQFAEFFPEDLKEKPFKVMLASKKVNEWVSSGLLPEGIEQAIKGFYEKYAPSCTAYLKSVGEEEGKADDNKIQRENDKFSEYLDDVEKWNSSFENLYNLNHNTPDPVIKKSSSQALSKMGTRKFDMQKDYKIMVDAIQQSMNDLLTTQQKQAEEKSDVAKEINQIPHITDKDKESLHLLISLVRPKEKKKVVEHVKNIAVNTPHMRTKNLKDFLKSQPLLKPRYLQKRASNFKSLPTHTNSELTGLFNKLTINPQDTKQERADKAKTAEGGHKLLDYIEKQVGSAKIWNRKNRDKVKLQMSNLVQYLNKSGNEPEELLKSLADAQNSEAAYGLLEDFQQKKDKDLSDTAMNNGVFCTEQSHAKDVTFQLSLPPETAAEGAGVFWASQSSAQIDSEQTDTSPAAQGAETAESTSAGNGQSSDQRVPTRRKSRAQLSRGQLSRGQSSRGKPSRERSSRGLQITTLIQGTPLSPLIEGNEDSPASSGGNGSFFAPRKPVARTSTATAEDAPATSIAAPTTALEEALNAAGTWN